MTPRSSPRLRVLIAIAAALAVLVAARYGVILLSAKPSARQEFQRRERGIMSQMDKIAESETPASEEPIAPAPFAPPPPAQPLDAEEPPALGKPTP